MACDTERRQFQMFKIECVEVTVGISVAERLNSKKNKKTPQLIKQDKSCEAENHQQWLCCNMCPEAAAVILLHYASEDGTVFSAAASVTRSVSPSSSSLPPVLCVSQAGMWTRDDKRCSCECNLQWFATNCDTNLEFHVAGDCCADFVNQFD